MKRYLLTALLISTSVIATQALAYGVNSVNNALNAVDKATTTVNKTADTVNAAQETQDRFTSAERNTYKEYYNKQSKNNHDDDDNDQGNAHDNKSHDKKYSSLPPGLQKKVASGKPLPPGWQKKVENGQVFDADLRSHSQRSPYTSPKGTSTYILEDKVIRVLDSTNTILDVLTK